MLYLYFYLLYCNIVNTCVCVCIICSIVVIFLLLSTQHKMPSCIRFMRRMHFCHRVYECLYNVGMILLLPHWQCKLIQLVSYSSALLTALSGFTVWAWVRVSHCAPRTSWRFLIVFRASLLEGATFAAAQKNRGTLAVMVLNTVGAIKYSASAWQFVWIQQCNESIIG